MNIEVFSDWKIFPLKTPVGNLLANGSVTICGTVSCKFKVLKGKDGALFGAFPSESYEKDGEKKYSNQVFLIDPTTRTLFQTSLLAEYAKLSTTSSTTNSSKTKEKTPIVF